MAVPGSASVSLGQLGARLLAIHQLAQSSRQPAANRAGSLLPTLPLPPSLGSTRPPCRLRRAAYSRPLRWLLALHGEAAVPFTYACLQAGATTRLLRNADQPEQQVASADAYLSVLQQGRIR